ncbi:MAG: Nif11-like leader peptide family natural product precursor [Alphaproteobacteria bacterium]|nr:Nif11-like leader peptide family natural product precursor [Alphaproteobacteria bacterium]MBV8407966.1 Nif11-like leader peptide family natural product precursor [Alphaproteobacteria bacterium]
MSIEAVQAFREQLKANEALQAAVKDALSPSGAIDPETVARVGRENGFDVTAGEIDAAFKAGGELLEVELELVAGGAHNR